MFNVIKSLIDNKNYKLSDIQYKIKKMYILGDLTEEKMNELLLLASLGASHEYERPETITLIETLNEKIESIENRLSKLEKSNNDENIEGDNTEIPEDNTPEYPEWKTWDGISKDYQIGAIVSHKGELWESVFNGQNVWEPGAVGTESLWIKYIPA